MHSFATSSTRHEPEVRLCQTGLVLVWCAWILLRVGSAQAQLAPTVLVPVVTDPTDAPRLIALAKLLRAEMADRDLPTVAVRYTATLEPAKASGDAFATALDLSGEFATLRYEFFSDELVRSHTLRLLELAKARTAILLAAPIANRIILKRITRADGESISLPDPCEPDLVRQALQDLLSPVSPELPAAAQTERSPLMPSTHKWLVGGSAALGTTAGILTVALAAKRRSLGNQFQRSAPSDSDFLSEGNDWRAPRRPMLATASVASASLSLAGSLFARDYDTRKLRWFSIPAAAIGAATLAWAATDIAHGAPCSADSGSVCVRAESQLDRGILLALLAAPPLAIATTHLGRWIHERIQLVVDTSPQAAGLTVAYRH